MVTADKVMVTKEFLEERTERMRLINEALQQLEEKRQLMVRMVTIVRDKGQQKPL